MSRNLISNNKFTDGSTRINRVQVFVNDVIESFYNINEDERTTYQVLAIIADHWKNVQKQHFGSITDYYTTLAKITDFLLKALTNSQGGQLQKINGQPVIVNQLNKANEVQVIVYLIDAREETTTMAFNQLRKYLVNDTEIITTQSVYIYSILDGSFYKWYQGGKK